MRVCTTGLGGRERVPAAVWTVHRDARTKARTIARVSACLSLLPCPVPGWASRCSFPSFGIEEEHGMGRVVPGYCMEVSWDGQTDVLPPRQLLVGGTKTYSARSRGGFLFLGDGGQARHLPVVAHILPSCQSPHPPMSRFHSAAGNRCAVAPRWDVSEGQRWQDW